MLDQFENLFVFSVPKGLYKSFMVVKLLTNNTSRSKLVKVFMEYKKRTMFTNVLNKLVVFLFSVLEYCSESLRIIPLWTVMLSYSLSSILTPVMSMYLSSWRALLVIATLPNFVVILADFFQLIPESLRWLLCKGRKENALKMVQKIAKFNRVQLNVSSNSLITFLTLFSQKALFLRRKSCK